MTTPDLASIIDAQEAEIGRLVAELAVVRRDWKADVGTLTAKLQTAEALAARLNTEVAYLLEDNEQMGQRDMQRAAAARKVAQFARKNMAAMQHVQRAQRERDAARAALERARALAEEWIAGDGETYGAKLLAQAGRRLEAALGGAR